MLLYRMNTILFCLLALFSFVSGQTEIVIVYTNNTNGILENCKCPDHAYGALEKRATVINKIRRQYPNVIVIDSGDIFDIQQDTLLHRYVSRAYKAIGYDVFTCGDQDFINGFAFFRSALMDLPMMFITSNIKFSDDYAVADHTIIKKNDVRIGITASLNPEVFKYTPPEVQQKIKVLDQSTSLQQVLPDLEKKSDYQILISHSGLERDRYLAENFPQFDLIIGGHSQTVLKKPEKTGSTLIVQAGESGYRVGLIKLNFRAHKVVSVENDLILLDENVHNDPKILHIIGEYHEKREKRIKERNKNE